MRQGKISLAVILVASSAFVYGCGETKRMESVETPKEAPAPVVAVAQPEPVPMGKYTVASHDTLWDIAGKTDIYSDSFQWPLIFKANRDQIQDPDLIFTMQNFNIKKDVSVEEVASAKDLASRTPKFVPHTKPRQALPIDYF